MMTLMVLCEEQRRHVEAAMKNCETWWENAQYYIEKYGNIPEDVQREIVKANERYVKRYDVYIKMRGAMTYEELSNAYCGN